MIAKAAPGLSRRRLLLAIGMGLAPGGPLRAAETLVCDELYKSFGVRGLEFADRVLLLRGQQVVIHGYMAPPLKPESAFFVLTREPVALCPFCQSDAEWPVDIVVVYLDKESPLVSAGAKVAVAGRLEIGSWTDPANGFVSQLRVVNASYRKL